MVNRLSKLGDKLHLNREQAQNILDNEILPTVTTGEEVGDVEYQNYTRSIMIDVIRVMFNSARWEDRFGAINGSVLLIKYFYKKNADGYIDSSLSDFVWNTIRAMHVPKLMTDPEFRVRNQIGPLLKELIAKDQVKGAMHFERLKDMLLKNIEETFTREPEGGVDASANPNVASKTLEGGKQIQINKDESGKTMHDTEGWKSLETSMRILQNIIEGIGVRLYDFNLDKILQAIIKGVDHINRFVREISYFVINAIFTTSALIFKTGDDTKPEHVERFRSFCDDLLPIISKGLADNWSQVRYAASQAVRSFYVIAKEDDELREKYDDMLVPRMCLNRYYVAEGVKIYSNETWKFVHGEKGKEILCKHAEAVCKFYISQSQADNHAVREAACHCIGELCTKVAVVDSKPFAPFVEDIMKALLDCFKDASWPVRDCACLACASFVIAFPEEAKTIFDELCELWFNHLSDNI